ncbi:MAG: hypothetical protein SPI12_01775 [Actinomycetaceae bacterium]|nr:hypothetical protein [Actinomycetaceae bacterium]MDY6082577.1 hypothetical protein [Actinomycetaceae bacterium]
MADNVSGKIRALTEKHKAAQVKNAEATGMGVAELARRLIDGEITSDDYVAYAVQFLHIGHDAAVRLAASYVKMSRQIQAPSMTDKPVVPAVFDEAEATTQALLTSERVKKHVQIVGTYIDDEIMQELDQHGLTVSQALASGEYVLDAHQHVQRADRVKSYWSNEAKQAVLSEAQGNASSTVQNAHRETLIDSFDLTGWRVVTDGHPCAFCAALAGMGEDVKGAKNWPDHYFHDHCGCTIEEVPFGTEPELSDAEKAFADLVDNAPSQNIKQIASYIRENGDGLVTDAHVPKALKKKPGRPKTASAGASHVGISRQHVSSTAKPMITHVD